MPCGEGWNCTEARRRAGQEHRGLALEASRAPPPVTAALGATAEDRLEYLRLLLAAHFSTVATFVPTDVDARIRHHAWMEIETTEALAKACDVVDEVAAWDARLVSARTLDVSPTDPSRGSISGHDGEWLGVRAGALGRALDARRDGPRRAPRRASSTASSRARRRCSSRPTGAERRAASPLGGDDPRPQPRRPLARRRGVGRQGRHRRYACAIHASRAPRQRGEAPRVRHRRAPEQGAHGAREPSLPLPAEAARAAHVARPAPAHRAMVRRVGREHRALRRLEDRDRAEIVTACSRSTRRRPSSSAACARSRAIHRATRGGLELHVPNLPARLRKDALRGKVRDALDVAPRALRRADRSSPPRRARQARRRGGLNVRSRARVALRARPHPRGRGRSDRQRTPARRARTRGSARGGGGGERRGPPSTEAGAPRVCVRDAKDSRPASRTATEGSLSRVRSSPRGPSAATASSRTSPAQSASSSERVSSATPPRA